MSLEEYLKFVQAHNANNLSINYLNQIICVHGFKKMHKTARVREKGLKSLISDDFVSNQST